MLKHVLAVLPLISLSLLPIAQADSADCTSLKLSRMGNASISGFGGLMATVSRPGSLVTSASPSSTYTCNNTTITNRNGEVRITGKTFADAVKQANRMQPYLYRDGLDNSRVIKVVFSTTNVAVNTTKYPLSYEAIGFSLDRGENIRPVVLEGRVYSPMRFGANDIAVIFTDDEEGVWGEAWISPRDKSIIFRP